MELGFLEYGEVTYFGPLALDSLRCYDNIIVEGSIVGFGVIK